MNFQQFCLVALVLCAGVAIQDTEAYYYGYYPYSYGSYYYPYSYSSYYYPYSYGYYGYYGKREVDYNQAPQMQQQQQQQQQPQQQQMMPNNNYNNFGQGQ